MKIPLKVWGLGRVGSGIALLLAFLMPWLEVSCEGHIMARPSGYNLFAGFLMDHKKVAGAPLLGLVLVAAIVLILMGAIGSRRSGSKVSGILAGLGAGSMLLKWAVETSNALDQGHRQGIRINLDWLGAFWLSLLILLFWTVAEWLPSRPEPVTEPGPDDHGPA